MRYVIPRGMVVAMNLLPVLVIFGALVALDRIVGMSLQEIIARPWQALVGVPLELLKAALG